MKCYISKSCIQLGKYICISCYVIENLNSKVNNVILTINSNLPSVKVVKIHWIYYIFIHILDIYGPLIIRLANKEMKLENSIPVGLGKFL